MHEEILTKCSLLRVERKRQEVDAKAVYTKGDHGKINCSSCPCLAGQEVNAARYVSHECKLLLINYHY